MVSIKHGSDSARPIGQGPIVHVNNRAPYRLDTARFSTGSIVYESVMQKRLGTGSIVHESFMQKRFGTGSVVHESVMQKRFSTSSIVLFYIILYSFFYILYFSYFIFMNNRGRARETRISIIQTVNVLLKKIFSLNHRIKNTVM